MKVMDLLEQARPASLDPEADPERRARDLAAAFADGQPGQRDPAKPARRIVIAGGAAVIAGGAAAAAALAWPGEPGTAPMPASPLQQAMLTAIGGVAADIFYTSRSGTGDDGLVTDTWWYPLSPQVGQQVRVRADVVSGDHVQQTATEWVYRQQPESPNTAVASSTEMTEVRYASRTWSRQIINAAFVQDPTFDPTGMRELVADGTWRAAGQTAINGRHVITLARHWRAAGRTYTQTLWVDARTYLPVRMVERDPGGSQRVDFGYLPPTTANLAKLTVTIPPGFTKTAHP